MQSGQYSGQCGMSIRSISIIKRLTRLLGRYEFLFLLILDCEAIPNAEVVERAQLRQGVPQAVG
jgi:hypothetical protein